MKRLEKESFVSSVRSELMKSSMVIAVNRSFGITVGQITKLRKNMHGAEANIKVLKNTLARIALKDSDFECLSDFFEGPTALAYSNNPVEMAKVLCDFSKENEKFAILGGVMDGVFINTDTVKALASLPPLDEIRGKIIGLLTAAAGKIARIVKEPSARIARVIAAKS